jgi:hypothetical protein
MPILPPVPSEKVGFAVVVGDFFGARRRLGARVRGVRENQAAEVRTLTGWTLYGSRCEDRAKMRRQAERDQAVGAGTHETKSVDQETHHAG